MKEIKISKPTKKIKLAQLTKEIRIKHSLGDKLYGLSEDKTFLSVFVDDTVSLTSTQVKEDVDEHIPEEQQEYVEDKKIREYLLLPAPSINQMREILKIIARRSIITPKEEP